MNGRSTPLDSVPPQPEGKCRCGCGKDAYRNSEVALGHGRCKLVPLAAEADRGHDTPCWVWLGSLFGNGYAEAVGHRLAHRWVYEQMVGPIPEGLTLDHLCYVRECVNPSHLEPVTLDENVRRQWAAGRADPGRKNREQTHCLRGHEFTSENTLVCTRRRRCRRCARERARRLREEARAL